MDFSFNLVKGRYQTQGLWNQSTYFDSYTALDYSLIQPKKVLLSISNPNKPFISSKDIDKWFNSLRLKHEYILPVNDLGRLEQESQIYFVQNMTSWRPLYDLKKPFNLKELNRAYLRLVEIVRFLHENKLSLGYPNTTSFVLDDENNIFLRTWSIDSSSSAFASDWYYIATMLFYLGGVCLPTNFFRRFNASYINEDIAYHIDYNETKSLPREVSRILLRLIFFKEEGIYESLIDPVIQGNGVEDEGYYNRLYDLSSEGKRERLILFIKEDRSISCLLLRFARDNLPIFEFKFNSSPADWYQLGLDIDAGNKDPYLSADLRFTIYKEAFEKERQDFLSLALKSLTLKLGGDGGLIILNGFFKADALVFNLFLSWLSSSEGSEWTIVFKGGLDTKPEKEKANILAETLALNPIERRLYIYSHNSWQEIDNRIKSIKEKLVKSLFTKRGKEKDEVHATKPDDSLSGLLALAQIGVRVLRYDLYKEVFNEREKILLDALGYIGISLTLDGQFILLYPLISYSFNPQLLKKLIPQSLLKKSSCEKGLDINSKSLLNESLQDANLSLYLKGSIDKGFVPQVSDKGFLLLSSLFEGNGIVSFIKQRFLRGFHVSPSAGYARLLLYALKIDLILDEGDGEWLNPYYEVLLDQLDNEEKGELLVIISLLDERKGLFRQARSRLRELFRIDKPKAKSYYYTNILNHYHKQKGFNVIERVAKRWLSLGSIDNEDINAQVLSFLGMALTQLGKTEEAFTTLSRVIEKEDSIKNILIKGYAYRYISLLYINSDLIKAKTLLDNAITYYQDNNLYYLLCSVYVDKGVLLNALEDYNESLECYNKAFDLFILLELNNRRAMCYTNIAIILHNKGEIRQAIIYLKKAEDYFLYKHNKKALEITYNNLGFTYIAIGMIEDALDYYNEGLRIDRTIFNPKHRVTILENTSEIYSRTGSFKGAIKALEDVQTLMNRKEITVKERASLFYVQGVFQECIGFLPNAASLYLNAAQVFIDADNTSDAMEPLLSYNRVLLRLGKTASVKEWLKKSSVPKSPLRSIQYRLLEARLYYMEGDIMRASEALSQVETLIERLPHAFYKLDYLDIKVMIAEGLRASYQTVNRFLEEALLITRKTGNKLDELHFILKKARMQRYYGYLSSSWNNIKKAIELNKNMYKLLPENTNKAWSDNEDPILLHKEILELSIRDFSSLNHLPKALMLPERLEVEEGTQETERVEPLALPMQIKALLTGMIDNSKGLISIFTSYFKEVLPDIDSGFAILSSTGQIKIASSTNLTIYPISILETIPLKQFYLIRMGDNLYFFYRIELDEGEVLLWYSRCTNLDNRLKDVIETYLGLLSHFYLYLNTRQRVIEIDKQLLSLEYLIKNIRSLSAKAIETYLLPRFMDIFNADSLLYLKKTEDNWQELTSLPKELSYQLKFITDMIRSDTIPYEIIDDTGMHFFIPILFNEEAVNIIYLHSANTIYNPSLRILSSLIQVWLNKTLGTQYEEEDYKRIKGELAEEIRLKNEFVAVASHELRTPLVLIQGYIELLEQEMLGNLTSEQYNALKVMQENTKRLIKLADEVITLTKVGSIEFAVSPKLIILDKLIQDIAALVYPNIQAKGIRFLFRREGDIDTMLGDEGRMHQAILNIINNSIKYTASKGEISFIISSPDPNHVLFEVTDTGIGIPDEECERIFSPFYKIEKSKYYSTTTIDDSGGGLGLAITKSIIEAHGGKIWVKSTIGEGTVFSFLLPRRRSADSHEVSLT